jgi:hypothetical protein
MMAWRAALLLTLIFAVSAAGGASPPDIGQRPGPYAAIMVTGSHRGQSHCYVCETGDRPAVIVFARTLSEPLGALVSAIDAAATGHPVNQLSAWMTLLGPDQAAADADLVRWAERHAIRNVPLGIFEDPAGPPSYRLSPRADCTVVLYVRRQVAATFTFQKGELSPAVVAEVMRALPRITPKAR